MACGGVETKGKEEVASHPQRDGREIRSGCWVQQGIPPTSTVVMLCAVLHEELKAADMSLGKVARFRPVGRMEPELQ